MLPLNQRDCRQRRINAVYADLNWQNLPLRFVLFDVVFAREVIEHVFDTDHFLDELYRVLKTGRSSDTHYSEPGFSV